MNKRERQSLPQYFHPERVACRGEVCLLAEYLSALAEEGERQERRTLEQRARKARKAREDREAIRAWVGWLTSPSEDEGPPDLSEAQERKAERILEKRLDRLTE